MPPRTCNTHTHTHHLFYPPSHPIISPPPLQLDQITLPEKMPWMPPLGMIKPLQEVVELRENSNMGIADINIYELARLEKKKFLVPRSNLTPRDYENR